jgi:hypothetical protein
MDVFSCECCVFSGRGLCDGLITRPEESYRVWCVWVWFRNLQKELAWARFGLLGPQERKMFSNLWINKPSLCSCLLVLGQSGGQQTNKKKMTFSRFLRGLKTGHRKEKHSGSSPRHTHSNARVLQAGRVSKRCLFSEFASHEASYDEEKNDVLYIAAGTITWVLNFTRRCADLTGWGVNYWCGANVPVWGGPLTALSSST